MQIVDFYFKIPKNRLCFKIKFYMRLTCLDVSILVFN
jgi:hypothetical protein